MGHHAPLPFLLFTEKFILMTQNSSSQSTPDKVAFWRTPGFRSILFQTLLVVGVISFGAFLVNNTLANLANRGISTGFDFLSMEAGFGIIQSLIDYDETYTFGRTFFVGLINTLLVSGLGIIFATILGFTVGIARLSNNWLIAKIAAVYVETFRNIPLLLQILFWYSVILATMPIPRNSFNLADMFFLNGRGFYLPAPVFEEGFWLVGIAIIIAIFGIVFLSKWAKKEQDKTGRQFPVFYTSLAILFIFPTVIFFIAGQPISLDLPALKGFNFKGGMVLIPEMIALLFALTVYTASFIAEIVRSGILSVSHGQTEAASALGIKQSVTIRKVIIPQAMRVIIPQLTSQFLNLTKNSSLATTVGYPDLVAVFAGTTLNQTGQAVEVVAMTMGVYLTISLVISMFMNWYNKRNQMVER